MNGINEVETSLLEGTRLSWPDILVIVAYLILVLVVGIWASRRSQRGNADGYFLASRNMHWIPVGASLYATNIGSGAVIGLAGSAASSGIAVHGYEQEATFGLLLLGWMFIPVYLAAGVYTLPQYLKLRFGGRRIRVYLSCLSLLLYIMTKISSDLYSGALFIQMALNKSSGEWLYLSVLFLLMVAAVFTIAGGLTAVVWTDLVQTVLMLVGAVTLMVMSLNAVGGYNALVNKYPTAVATNGTMDLHNQTQTCGRPPEDYMSLWRSSQPGRSDFPWTGMVFGLTIIQVWYWCTEQVTVQRTLASRDISHAKGGCILAAHLKTLSLWLMVLPGMASRILYPERVACASPKTCLSTCGNPKGCTNIAYAELVLNVLPTGVKGMMLAVIMAALMSSLTSVFNSASTIFTIDIWAFFRSNLIFRKQPSAKPSDKELIIVGRIFVAIMVIISVVWIPVIQNAGNSQLFDYVQSVLAYLAPPICAVFLLAIFWTRTTEPGAFWGLMVGLAVGMIRFVFEFSYTLPPCGSGEPDPRPVFLVMVVGRVHYLHFCCFSWIITMAVTICVSLVTKPISSECLYRLTFWTRHDTRIRRSVSEDDDLDEFQGNHLMTRPVNASAAPSAADVPVHESSGSNADGHNSEENKLKQQGQLQQQQQKQQHQQEKQVHEQQQHQQRLAEEQEQIDKFTAFLYESPHCKKMTSVNAFICIAIAAFVYGFYA